MGFTGVYVILFISALKHTLWVHVRTASQKYEKYQNLNLKTFSFFFFCFFFVFLFFFFFVVTFPIHLNRRAFVMAEAIFAKKKFFLKLLVSVNVVAFFVIIPHE